MKAIALISGGLDSILAARLIQEQRIEVIPLNFQIPFCHREKINQPGTANLVAEGLGQELKSVDISDDFLKLLEHPRYGFGSLLNPCIDCKILMFTKARELLGSWQADFVVTGEVLGQRPMSQHRQALDLIEAKSGLTGLLLRPLSAKLLKPTFPEQKGWLEREKLLNFSGRTRRPQMDLAKTFEITNYPNASGGCLLTDPEFAHRLEDLLKHQELDLDNVRLLKYGRHFRFAQGAKLVVGRNETENQALETLAKAQDYLFFPNAQLAGPTALGRGKFSRELLELCCRITCYYCDLQNDSGADIIYRKVPEAGDIIFKAQALDKEHLSGLRI